MIELAAIEIESTHQRINHSVAGPQRHERGLDLRHLHDLPAALVVLADSD